MRQAEVISVAFFASFGIAAMVAPLPTPKRVHAAGIGACGTLIVLLMPALEAVPGGAVLRDFVPSLLLIVGYWQTGAFVTGGDGRFQACLERFDRRWLPRSDDLTAWVGLRPIASSYFEAAYLACYPIVPLAVAVLYLGGRGHAIDPFWRVVLPATFATHGLTTVFQSLPPWMKHTPEPLETTDASTMRSVNRWVTEHASIRFNSFPSGHVACAFAVALSVMAVFPIAGAVFLWLAASIAVAVIVLRHHYGLDVLLAIVLAVTSFALFR